MSLLNVPPANTGPTTNPDAIVNAPNRTAVLFQPPPLVSGDRLRVSSNLAEINKKQPDPFGSVAFLPTSAALSNTETALRELYGNLFYRIFRRG